MCPCRPKKTNAVLSVFLYLYAAKYVNSCLCSLVTSLMPYSLNGRYLYNKEFSVSHGSIHIVTCKNLRGEERKVRAKKLRI